MNKNKKSKSKKIQSRPKSNLFFYLILAVITFIVYSNSISNEFVFDDESVVLGDPSITDLSNIPKYFTGDEGFHRVIGRYYRPIVSASYAIDHALWKLDPNGFHFTNILIHVVNTLLLFWLLKLLFRKQLDKNDNGLYIILLSALIFGVSTIHTEAVTWVSGRTDSLSFTFFTLSFIYYIKYNIENINKNIVLTILFFIAALLAKEMAITLPLIIILYDLFDSGYKTIIRNKKKLTVYGLLFLTASLYMIWRWYILKDVEERLNYNYFYGESFLTTIATMLTTLPLYFRLTFIPIGLLYHYNGYLPYQYSIASFNVIASILFIAVLLTTSYILIKKLPLTSFSIFIFLITLIPVMNIVPTMNFMAERFLYIPSIIVSIIIAELSFKFWRENRSNYIFGTLIFMIIIYSILTYSRNKDWANNDSLFLSAEGKPGTVTYVNIGNIHANKGKIDDAEVYYRKAIDIRDKTLLANNNLGKVFLVKNNFDSAYHYMHKAHLLDTLSPEPMFSLAQLYAKADRLDEAIHYLEKMQMITPNYMNSAQLLQNLKIQKTNSTGQNNSLNMNDKLKISQLETESYQAYSAKDYNKSIRALNELIKLNPIGNPGYYNNLGMCYLELKDFNQAEHYFKESTKMDPLNVNAINNLGKVYELTGKKELAKEYYKKALEADPNNIEAKANIERLK